MYWFLAGAQPADPRHWVVSVLRTEAAREPGGRTAGAGVLLPGGQLLTCAHVVNDALGRPFFEYRPPGGVRVPVVLYGPSGPARYEAELAYWIPPRRVDGTLPVRARSDREWLGDLAVLVLDRCEAPQDRPPPTPAWAPMAVGQRLRAWHSSTLGSSFADVRVKTVDSVLGYVDGEATGMAIGPAYSGGPLWCVAEEAAVGLVAAHVMPPADPATGAPLPHSSQHIARRSWGIPWQRIESELLAAGAYEVFAPADAGPGPGREDPALLPLAEFLEAAVPAATLLADHARATAENCGYTYRKDGSSPDYEEFAEFLVTEPRALAALTDVLRRTEPRAADGLLALGRLSPVPALLSPREHRTLTRNLDAAPPEVLGRLSQVVRAALPLAAALPAGATPGELLARLELLPGDSRSDTEGTRVPGLLRVVEYLAALCPPTVAHRLHNWSNGVARRLGLPAGALSERRADAAAWAAAQGTRIAPLRILVQVAAAGPGYRLRLWCDEGAGPRQVSTDGDTVYTGSEAARELMRTLDDLCRAAPGERRPMVEALVDRAGLNIPIDEWESTDPETLLPGVLGAEYPLVVNCPELLRRNERFLPDWRRRWRQLDTGTSLRFSDSTVGLREIYGTLMDRLDAVRVAVALPPGLRDEIVQVCLAVGVPVVLWDRGAQARDSDALDHISGVTTRELPEGVRSYRARTVYRPGDHPGRPVLAWADADRVVPRLHLAEPHPQESA
ncbi:trypsin-like peptidase domain-containing protein [Streptomyces sp. NPDC056549]|uniref:VMAP-C domain-containing protein n=1 Tax=Streptomyces sp. NPDC056549 TaxID=3345864 RepID=UPI0036BC4CEA